MGDNRTLGDGNQAGRSGASTHCNYRRHTENKSFLLYLISFTEVKGLPNGPHIQFTGEFGMRSGSPDKAAIKGSMQKASANFPNQHDLQRVIQLALQQVEWQQGRHFLERKIGFYLFFPPINKCRHLFILLAVSWHLKHLSREWHFPATTNRHTGWDRMYLFYPQLLQLISSTFCPFSLLFCHLWLPTTCLWKCSTFHLCMQDEMRRKVLLLSLRWASVAQALLCSRAELDRLMTELLFSFPGPKDRAGLPRASPTASVTAENVFIGRKTTQVTRPAPRALPHGEPPCWSESTRVPGTLIPAGLSFPPTPL